MSSLKILLRSTARRNCFKQEFWLEESITYLITARNITQYLTTRLRSKAERLKEYVDSTGGKTYLDLIVSSAKKLFTILVLCDKEYFVFELLWQGFNDDSLPFGTSSKLPEGLGDSPDIFKVQWGVIAPIFVQGSEYTLPPETILPFETEDHLGKGVEKVRIHPAHMEPVANQARAEEATSSSFQDYTVACKRICTRSPGELDAFNRESAVLKSLLAANVKHRHIVELFSIYSQGQEHYIMMSCGDFDLNKVFEMNDGPPAFGALEELKKRTLWRSLYSLASALDYLHGGTENVITHQDIKPTNVIIKGDMFQIADFGLSSLKSSDDTKTDWHGGTYSYSPPEYFARAGHDGRFGRAVDIWSLGCVFSEIMTLAIYGWGREAVQKFKRHRQNGPNIHLHESQKPDASFHNNVAEVMSWLGDLPVADEGRNGERARAVVQSMLCIDPTIRPDAKTVATELENL